VKLACPRCGTVHEIEPSQEGGVLQCSCGQMFKAALPEKAPHPENAVRPREQSEMEPPGGLAPDADLASDSMVLKKFMTETGADPEKSHWIWRYWRGLVFIAALFLFYGLNFVFRTFVRGETTTIFISLFLLNFIAFGLRKSIREQSFAFWPGISIAVLTLFYLSWGSIFASKLAISALLSMPILMFLVVKRMELFLFGIGFITNLILMSVDMKAFSPLIVSHLLTAAVWLIYRKNTASQTAGMRIAAEPSRQIPPRPDPGPLPSNRKSGTDSPGFGKAGPEDLTAPLRLPALVVIAGFETGQKLLLHQGHYTIGRGEGCHLRLSDGGVSRKHASLQVIGGEILFKDEGSHNGSLVNDQAVQSCSLVKGDVITIGQTKIRVDI